MALLKGAGYAFRRQKALGFTVPDSASAPRVFSGERGAVLDQVQALGSGRPPRKSGI